MTMPKIGEVATGDHGPRVIKAPHSEFDAEGRLLFRLDKLKTNFDDIREACRGVRFQGNNRRARVKAGLGEGKTSDISFGFKPNRPIFGLAASCCRFNTMYPRLYARLGELGRYLMLEMSSANLTKYIEQKGIVGAIAGDWLIPETFFTQGIINNAVSLEYHFDRGNFKGCWSCMTVFKKDIDGGDLVIPELGVTLELDDEAVLFFDGQALLHGVTPIVKKTSGAYRYSIVYYAIEAMKHCGTYAEEIKKIRDTEQRKIMARLRPE